MHHLSHAEERTLPGNSLPLVSDPPARGRVKTFKSIHFLGVVLMLLIPDPDALRGRNS
jgi:hypothetical protein